MTKLSFPLQLVFIIVSMVLSAAGTIWVTQSGIRSDIRDIRTRMEMQAELEVAQKKLDEERATALREAVQDMKRRQELQQYEIQGLKEAILKQQAQTVPIR